MKKLHVSGQLAMSVDGYLAPKHSIFFSVATIPFYLVFGSIGTMYFNLFLTICLNLLIYEINRAFFNKKVSLITTFIFATGTIIMNYSYNYLAEVFSTVLLAWALFYVIKKNYYLASIILGLSCFAKVSNVPWAGIIFIYIIWDYVKNRIDWSQKNNVRKASIELLGIGTIFLISLSPFFITNYFLYGGIMTTGYHRSVSLDENYNLYLLDGAAGFTQEFWSGLYNVLFHPSLGLIEAKPSCHSFYNRGFS